MKTILRFRFVWVALLLNATLFTACKKENVEPTKPADAATQAAGKYTYSELSYDGKTLPANQTNLKGTITITRQTESTVEMVLDIRQKSSNEEFIVMDVSDVNVVDAGAGKLSLVYDGQEIGALKGNKVSINGVDDSNIRFTISATK